MSGAEQPCLARKLKQRGRAVHERSGGHALRIHEAPSQRKRNFHAVWNFAPSRADFKWEMRIAAPRCELNLVT